MGRMIRLGRAVRRQRDGDGGFTLIELLLASSLSAILLAMTLIWLFSAQRASDQIAGELDDETGLSLTLELALAELSDARPTALCLNPDPNSQSEPSPTTTSATPPTPPATTVPPCDSAGRGDNWGYWPTVSSGTRMFVSGSPFSMADDDELCFYALPKGTVADPASTQTPHGRCLEMSADNLLSRTLEPATAANSDDLVAADPDNYDWTSGTWTERSLGRIKTISFEYHDFDGHDITPTGINTLDEGKLDDIAVVTITLTLDVTPTPGAAPTTAVVSGSLAIRANVYSPCRQQAAAAPTCPLLDTPGTPTLNTSTSTQIAASWTLSGHVPATSYAVQYKKTSDTAWTDFTGTVSGTTATITGLTSSESYDVRVRATNDADTSDWSATATATVT